MSLKQIYDSPRYRKMLALLEKKPCLGLSEMPIINRKTLPFATERVAVRVCLCVFVCSRGDFNLSVVMSPLWSSLCSVAICSVAWSSTRQSFLCLPLYFCHLLFLSFYLFTVSSRYLSSVFLFFFFFIHRCPFLVCFVLSLLLPYFFPFLRLSLLITGWGIKREKQRETHTQRAAM